MGYHSLIYAVPTAVLMTYGSLAVGNSAAQELPQCSIEGKPCGTPEQLYIQIRHCLRDPYLCRDPRRVSAAQISDGMPASSQSAQSNANSATIAHVVLHRTERLPPSVPRSIATDARSADSEKTPPDKLVDAVEVVARLLPLDLETRELNDALPSQPANVERRLGLRPTRVAGTDLRDRTPSAAEIVAALAPKGKAVP
jgi:hypothetical protein